MLGTTPATAWNDSLAMSVTLALPAHPDQFPAGNAASTTPGRIAAWDQRDVRVLSCGTPAFTMPAWEISYYAADFLVQPIERGLDLLAPFKQSEEFR